MKSSLTLFAPALALIAAACSSDISSTSTSGNADGAGPYEKCPFSGEGFQVKSGDGSGCDDGLQCVGTAGSTYCVAPCGSGTGGSCPNVGSTSHFCAERKYQGVTMGSWCQ